MGKIKMEEKEADDPDKIIADCVKQRKKLLGGIGGAYDVNRKAFDLSFKEFPSHWAISLSGEPTIYPKLGELVRALRNRKEVRSIFVVTNGQETERIMKMANESALPTQLYVSLAAPNEDLHRKINRPINEDGWQRLNKTLELLPNLACRKVIRLTLIKGVNDAQEHIPKYAELLEKSKADFIEIKSYMHLGLSRERLERKNMPTHEEIKQFGARLLEMIPYYRYENEDDKSRIMLLKRKNSEYENLIKKA
jgi:tRNA wybutosine-synthesizing protein 1